MLYDTKNPHGGDVYSQELLLDFSANTNPYGTPQGVLDAIRESLPQLHHYPDPYCRELVQAIAAFEGVDQAYILCGNGAADLIYAYAQAVKPRLGLELAPTFSEYALGMEQSGCRMMRYSLDAACNFDVDEGLLDVLGTTDAQVLFLCSPNNPTGRCIDPDLAIRILTLCRQRQIRVFADECFLDLCDGGSSLKKYLADFLNLLILKAFTKSYGMAGLRLGYCMSADRALLKGMSAASQPWNVSTVAQNAGIAALRETEFLEKTRKTIAQERQWLFETLTHLGFSVIPSRANYLLFHGQPGLAQRLRRRGIAIRDCNNYHGLGEGWYRIAVRLHDENEILIRTIKEEVITWQNPS